MYHPDAMMRLAQDRFDRYEQDAQQSRRARDAREAARAAAHSEPHERFSVRNLRWMLFRPSGA